MNNWVQILDHWSSDARDCVLITVVHTAGSAPREAGSKMIVATDEISGTIGGGNLEHTAIQRARSLLSRKSSANTIRFLDLYALGPMLEQCCGGVVFLHYELVNQDNYGWIKTVKEINERSQKMVIVSRSTRPGAEISAKEKLIVTDNSTTGSLGELEQDAIAQARQLLANNKASSHAVLKPLVESKGSLPDIGDALVFDVLQPCDFHIALFGAGHVGSAIIAILQQSVSCRITWIDSRKDVFPIHVPDNVVVRHALAPAEVVEELPAKTYYLIMTHSHDLDQALCETIMNRVDYQFLGLIGSETKYKRFKKRLSEKGVGELDLKRLICPIGIENIHSKEPGSIAVSVVAQLLQLHEKNTNRHYLSDVKKITSQIKK